MPRWQAIALLLVVEHACAKQICVGKPPAAPPPPSEPTPTLPEKMAWALTGVLITVLFMEVLRSRRDCRLAEGRVIEAKTEASEREQRLFLNLQESGAREQRLITCLHELTAMQQEASEHERSVGLLSMFGTGTAKPRIKQPLANDLETHPRHLSDCSFDTLSNLNSDWEARSPPLSAAGSNHGSDRGTARSQAESQCSGLSRSALMRLGRGGTLATIPLSHELESQPESELETPLENTPVYTHVPGIGMVLEETTPEQRPADPET